MHIIYEAALLLFDTNPLLFLAVCAAPGIIVGGLLGLRPMRQAEQSRNQSLALALGILCFLLYAILGTLLLFSLQLTPFAIEIVGLALGIALGVPLYKRMVRVTERTNARRMGGNEFVSSLVDRIERERPAAFYVCDDGVAISAASTQDHVFFLPRILEDELMVIPHQYTSDFSAFASTKTMSIVRFADSGYEDMSDANTKKGFADALQQALPAYQRWEGESTHDEFRESDNGEISHDGRLGYWVKVTDYVAFVFVRTDLNPKMAEPTEESKPKPRLKSW